MHNYGIVIKPTTVSVEDGRRALGEVLIDCGECDWYMTGTYREKYFGENQVITLKEFKDNYLNDYITQALTNNEAYYDNNVSTFCTIEPNVPTSHVYVDRKFTPNSFYEANEYPNIRKELLTKWTELYVRAFTDIVNNLLKSDINYDVTLLYYHN